MDKKIISIFLLLIIFVSIAVTYSYFNQSITKEKQYDGSIETIDEEDIVNEIDNIFLEEDDEIELGEMIF
jgi:type II secretory pathway component PulC